MKMINYLFSPGDLIAQHWLVNKEQVLTALYLIYDKEETIHSPEGDIGYTSFKGYVVYSFDPYGREDRSGLNNVGETYEIVQWNDMDALDPLYPSEWVKVVESGLSWEDVD